LLPKDAKIFNTDPELLDNSPFFLAIQHNQKDILEILCDFGIDTNTPNSTGEVPLIMAAKQDRDDICMYLSLRTNNITIEDEEGKTIFIHYMLKRDMDRMN
jgi:ankyrin repeat protein